jgi:hypothetical protein
MRPSECRQRSAARPPGTPGPAARRLGRCPVPAGGPPAAPPPPPSRDRPAWSRCRSSRTVTIRDAVHRLRPGRVSLVSRRRPWPRHERRPPKNAENACPGGERARVLCVQCQNTRRPPMSLLCRKIRGSLSLHPSLQPASALPVACTCGAARRRLARESWSGCAAWCRQPARRSGGLAATDS